MEVQKSWRILLGGPENAAIFVASCLYIDAIEQHHTGACPGDTGQVRGIRSAASTQRHEATKGASLNNRQTGRSAFAWQAMVPAVKPTDEDHVFRLESSS